MAVWATLVALVPVVSFTGVASAAGDGVIDGQVLNGTQGGSPTAGLMVVLHAVGEGGMVERWSATTDGDGRYRFEGLDTRAELRYLPVVEYQEATYFPRPLILNEQPQQSADITVYEATSSDEWIAFERTNLLIQNIAPSRLDVMEMGAVVNVGNRTYRTSETGTEGIPPTLRFPVPAGAFNLTPQTGFAPNDFSPSADGFTISSAVLPGRHQLAYSYSLAYDAHDLELVKQLEYPAATFTLYVPDVGVRVDNPLLTPQGRTELGGQKFLLYGARELPRGTELRIRLSGLPAPPLSVAQQFGPPILGLGGAMLLTTLALAYRRRISERASDSIVAPGTEAGEPDESGLERAQLLVSLANLDERFEKGALSEEQYRREREASKQRLLALSGPPSGTRTGGE